MRRRASTIRLLASRFCSARFADGGALLVDLDAFFSPIGLDHDVDRLDDLLVWVCLTVDDDPVLNRLGAIDEHHVLLSQSVVPAAVPDRQIIGVFLIGVRELSTGERLDIDITVLVCIGGQIDLSDGRRRKRCQSDVDAPSFVIHDGIHSFAGCSAKTVKIGNPPDNFELCKKAIALSYRVDIDQPAKPAMKFTAQTRASHLSGSRENRCPPRSARSVLFRIMLYVRRSLS